MDPVPNYDEAMERSVPAGPDAGDAHAQRRGAAAVPTIVVADPHTIDPRRRAEDGGENVRFPSQRKATTINTTFFFFFSPIPEPGSLPVPLPSFLREGSWWKRGRPGQPAQRLRPPAVRGGAQARNTGEQIATSQKASKYFNYESCFFCFFVLYR